MNTHGIMMVFCLLLCMTVLAAAEPAGDLASQIQAARELRIAGKPAQARVAFEAAMKSATTPTDRAQAMLGVAESQMDEKNAPAARATAEQVLEIPGITPDHTGRALLVIGQSHMAEYKWMLAKQAMEKAFGTPGVGDSLKFDAQLFLGRIGESYSGLPDAKKAYTTALNQPGISATQRLTAQQALAKVLMGLHEYAPAKPLLRELLTNENLTGHPRATLHNLLAKATYFEGDYQSARAEFAKLLQMQAPLAIPTTVRAEAQLYIGLCDEALGDVTGAERAYQTVLTMPDANARPQHQGGPLPWIPAREAALRLGLKQANSQAGQTKPIKVLFIGSSHTARNDVPGLITKIADSAPADWPRILTSDYLRMGTTIVQFWNDGDAPDTARQAIANLPWDVVVYESTYNLRPDELQKFGSLFAEQIKARGARAVLYESAIAQAKAYPADYVKYHNDTVALSKTINASVGPYTYALTKYFGSTPPTPEQLSEVYSDWIHTSPAGAYFAACTLYAAITGKSPVGLYFPKDLISETKARQFQEIAWQTYLEANAAAEK